MAISTPKKRKLEVCPNPPKIWAISKLLLPTKTGDMQARTYDQNMAIVFNCLNMANFCAIFHPKKHVYKLYLLLFGCQVVKFHHQKDN
jgi:hypothetical protein